MSEWWYISSTEEKDEQKRDVSGDREVDLVFCNDVVPIVSVNHKEDDSDDKDDVGVHP